MKILSNVNILEDLLKEDKSKSFNNFDRVWNVIMFLERKAMKNDKHPLENTKDLSRYFNILPLIGSL